MAAPIDVIGMACRDCNCDFKPWKFQRRAPGDCDVFFKVAYCGVCHSDLHNAASHFKDLGVTPTYPAVLGHEISGVVIQVGVKVKKFKVGDHIGVGCMVDSCLTCSKCNEGHEQYCKNPAGTGIGVQVYQDVDKHGRAAVWPPGSKTQGGYSTHMVVNERFGILIPKSYPLECAGPVMCSGITVYDPMVTYGCKAGSKVGVAGLGGLGGMGIKIAKALGCKVFAISRGEQKRKLAKTMGADEYIDSKSPESLAQWAGCLDLILDTIPAYHDVKLYEALVATNGKLILLGLTPTFLAAMYAGSKTVKTSCIGGIKNTEAVLALCDKASPKILPAIEIKPVQALNSIFTKLDESNDSGVRYVLDIQGSLGEKTFGTCNEPAPKIKPAHGMDVKMVLHELFKLMGCWCCQK